MNYYIADCHFNHRNSLDFERSCFADAREMEDTMVANWNAAVTPNDTVYILGDFCWGDADEWLRILGRLAGHKKLIVGNHDVRRLKKDDEVRAQFEEVASYLEVKDNKRMVILCHYPILFYHNCRMPTYYMLCGHVHDSAENDLLEQWTAQLRAARADPASPIVNRGQIYNVGCMMPWMGYTPRTLDEIVRGMEAAR